MYSSFHLYFTISTLIKHLSKTLWSSDWMVWWTPTMESPLNQPPNKCSWTTLWLAKYSDRMPKTYPSYWLVFDPVKRMSRNVWSSFWIILIYSALIRNKRCFTISLILSNRLRLHCALSVWLAVRMCWNYWRKESSRGFPIDKSHCFRGICHLWNI